jgi:hypothetical protein
VIDFQGGGLRDIGFELWAELCNVVGKERGLAAGAGDGDVAEAGVEQVWMDAGVGVNKDPFISRKIKNSDLLRPTGSHGREGEGIRPGWLGVWGV